VYTFFGKYWKESEFIEETISDLEDCLYIWTWMWFKIRNRIENSEVENVKKYFLLITFY